MTTDTKRDPLLTVKQLAQREEMTESAVRHLLAAKSLPYYKINGIRIRLSEYLSWLEGRRVQ